LKSRFTSTPHAPDRPCGSLRPGHLAKYFPLTRTTRDLRWRSKISESHGKKILFACALSVRLQIAN
jgi:hypothetical protein